MLHVHRPRFQPLISISHLILRERYTHWSIPAYCFRKAPVCFVCSLIKSVFYHKKKCIHVFANFSNISCFFQIQELSPLLLISMNVKLQLLFLYKPTFYTVVLIHGDLESCLNTWILSYFLLMNWNFSKPLQTTVDSLQGCKPLQNICSKIRNSAPFNQYNAIKCTLFSQVSQAATSAYKDKGVLQKSLKCAFSFAILKTLTATLNCPRSASTWDISALGHNRPSYCRNNCFLCVNGYSLSWT